MEETLAKKLGALIIIGEHRYYGESEPFGKQSFAKYNGKFMSMENILMDNARLIEHVKKKFDAEDQPVITFGGSYSGMLATWMRMKFPNHV